MPAFFFSIASVARIGYGGIPATHKVVLFDMSQHPIGYFLKGREFMSRISIGLEFFIASQGNGDWGIGMNV
jgi:uncharacterized membrane protein